MRLFIALDIDDHIRRRLADYVARLNSLVPNVKWVRPESLHVTLKFIGEFPEARLGELTPVLSTISGQPFNLSFRTAGFFTPRSPRIFWAGIEAGHELKALAAAVDQAVTPLGIAKEDRDFAPHLTLARSGSGRPHGAASDRNKPVMYGLQARVEAMPPPDFGTMTAREFFLYQSKTAPTGAVYTKLERFPLG
ncbi:MAG: RNA 2',3'-cyclic phosphodiesterase [Candidatus Koribacter versatilis]|uniref:RNA 2',3'-cyclic phosphodiesterase n=1 Tax=Candidatus Korobacter versatilis TaxID=658062 RepID=A0A932EPU5_9BACT|nr:RNA 2',3'-cyclic phosphodiesterase [Candidatus Koribacter versatilis]